MIRPDGPRTMAGARTRRWGLLAAALVFSGPALCQSTSAVAETADLALSPAVRDLLRAEMVEIAGGVQGIALALASGDWQAVADTGARIRASYILEQRLTPDQASELETALPEGFKRIDADFHRRADRLRDAALAHDAELAAFHYARLIESCSACHAAYAQARFPGFAPGRDEAQAGGHRHE